MGGGDGEKIKVRQLIRRLQGLDGRALASLQPEAAAVHQAKPRSSQRMVPSPNVAPELPSPHREDEPLRVLSLAPRRENTQLHPSWRTKRRHELQDDRPVRARPLHRPRDASPSCDECTANAPQAPLPALAQALPRLGRPPISLAGPGYVHPVAFRGQ